MNIQPIRSEEDHRAALVEIERLWGSQPGSEDADKLELIATLVEKYEDNRWPIERPEWDPVDVLNYAISEMGHTQAELSSILGSPSRASEILRRHRPLTVDMIYKISEAWKIPASLLVKPYKVLDAA